MAANVTIIKDTSSKTVVSCTNIFTGSTQESNVTKVTANSLSNYNSGGLVSPPVPILSITRIVYSITQGCSVQIIFDGSVQQLAAVLTGQGEFFLDGMAITNTATTTTGNIVFTTTNFASGNSYDILLVIQKQAGF